MKKKILMAAAVLISTVCIISCAPGKIEEIPTEHTHDYKVTDTVEATCQKEGYAVYTCECGESYRSKIEKKAHEFELTEVVAATTEQAGSEKFQCKNCDEYYINEIPILSADDPNNDNPKGDDPVDENPGNEHFHDYYVADSKEPTCKEKGYVVYNCKRCEESYTVEAEIVDHHYELTAVVEATPEQEGYEEYACKFCGLSFRVPLFYEG